MARVKTKVEPEEASEFTEVELLKHYKDISSIIVRHSEIKFTDGKAVVSSDTAKSLKEQGFVK